MLTPCFWLKHRRLVTLWACSLASSRLCLDLLVAQQFCYQHRAQCNWAGFWVLLQRLYLLLFSLLLNIFLWIELWYMLIVVFGVITNLCKVSSNSERSILSWKEKLNGCIKGSSLYTKHEHWNRKVFSLFFHIVLDTN